jgi:hypothetical protein
MTQQHYFDDIDGFDFSDSYEDLDFEESYQESKRARRNRKEMVRKELDRRMDMRRLRKLIDTFESDDFD